MALLKLRPTLLAALFSCALLAQAQEHAHYYAWQRGTTYGYELEQTEFEREHTAHPPSISYWYEGRQGTVYHLRQFNGVFVDIISCQSPCSSVHILNARVDKTMTVRQETALWAAIQDMLAGRLAVHQ